MNPTLNPLRHPSIAAPCLVLVTACAQHRVPPGTVSATDVPAGPTNDAATPDANPHALACERVTGAEREACLRQYPPRTTMPVEPEKSPPPQSQPAR